MKHKTLTLGASLVLALLAAGCGESASFLGQEKKTGFAAAGGSNADATPTTDETAGDKAGSDTPLVLPTEGTPGGGCDAPGGDCDGGGDDDLPGGGCDAPGGGCDVPDADDDDKDALAKCLAKWKNHPFKSPITNYKKIFASVTVGGFGNAVNDTERSAEPFLTLIAAGVNVIGQPTYNLMNPNGYYCIKVNVNVLAKLTVNLHCSARLADEKVNVNVLSSQTGNTASVGVHVLSTVDVKTVKPQGDQCIR